MTRLTYCASSARVIGSGRTQDKSHRTAGDRARSDPPLQVEPLRMPRFRRWLSRIGR